jgi:uncharacterized cupin superfamily protein
MLRKTIIAAGMTAVACITHAQAAGGEWKDGVLFAEEELTSLEGHTAYKIVFGLQPGKCAGEFTAPDEWLKMTEGTITFSYPGKDDVVRSVGDHWAATAGTKVTLCNKGDQNAVLVGVQMRKN